MRRWWNFPRCGLQTGRETVPPLNKRILMLTGALVKSPSRKLLWTAGLALDLPQGVAPALQQGNWLPVAYDNRGDCSH